MLSAWALTNSSLETRESDSRGVRGGWEEDAGSDVAAGAGVGAGSGQEVLGTDTGSGDSGAVCGAGAASVVQEGGRAARHGRGLGSTQCALYATLA